MPPRILLVEDDESLGFVLQAYLKTQDFRVEWVRNGQEAFSVLKKSKFDLCLLDIMMPKMDGMELAQKIRARKDYIPIIFLTAKALKADKLKGFDLGADDYLVKPIDEEELVARIRAVLRRSKAPQVAESSYQIGKFTFDPANQKLFNEEQAHYLTELEGQLLQMLCDRKGQLLARKYALQKLWGKEDYFTRRSMDVFISRLRKYLAPDENIKIRNVHGSGFVLEVKSSAE
ncbi:MAG: response regulator transcription factor [Bacteroidota bacterium]